MRVSTCGGGRLRARMSRPQHMAQESDLSEAAGTQEKMLRSSEQTLVALQPEKELTDPELFPGLDG